MTDITQKKKSEILSTLEKERYQLVIDEMDAAVFEWDLKTGSFYCSEAYKKYAISQADTDDILQNRASADLVHPNDLSVMQKFFEETNQGKEKVETTLRLRMTDNSYRWCRMIGLFHKDEQGVPSNTIGIIIDVNDEHEKNAMLDGVLSFMPGGIGIWKFGETLECEYYNDGFARMAGLSRAEIDQRIADNTILSSIIAPVDFPYVSQRLDELVSQGENLDLTYRYLYSDGSVRWLQLAGIKLHDTDGCPVYYCMFTNPTNEATLYRNIVEDSTIGVLVADVRDGNVNYINDAAKVFYEISQETVGSLNILKHLELAGRKRLLTREQLLSLREDDYTEFHVESNGRYYSINGKTLSWNGIASYILYISDETEIKQQHVRLQKLVNRVPAGIGIYEIHDGVVNLTSLNDAYYKMLGFKRGTRTHLMGSNSINVIYPDDMEAVSAMIQRLIDGAQECSVQHRIQNSEGDWVWINLAASVVERHGSHLLVYVSFTDCDTLIRSQLQLIETQKKEQALLNSIPGGVAIYHLKKDGRITTEYISEGLARMRGYTQTELFHTIKENALANVPESEYEKLNTAIKDGISNHKPISVAYLIHRKDQPDLLNRLDANMIETTALDKDDASVWYAVHTIVSDNTKLALKEQEHYRTVLGMLGIAYWEWSKQNGFYASSSYSDYALSQIPFETVRGRAALTGIIHPEDESVLKEYFSQDSSNSKSSSITVRMHMTDGSYSWTEMNTFKDISPSGELLRLSGTLRNVNDEWIAQKRILQNALDEARVANQAKTAFLSRISHDMRTPLNGILGLTSLMREKPLDDDLRHDVGKLEMSGQYLLNLINDTLDMSRIESGKLELHPIVCDGHEIINNTLRLALPGMQEKHIHFNVHADNLPFTILYLDVPRIQQIVMNILGNAIKFTPAGGSIDFTMTNLSIENGIITDKIEVRDTGIGINADFLPHIFEAFSQADTSKTSSVQGTGLGMAITKRLVSLMGGDIAVTSEPGTGTCFTFTIQMPIATAEQIEAWKKEQSRVSEEVSLKGKRILLCEDHPLNTEIAIRMLQTKGILVEHARNGQLGVEMFEKSRPDYYDAILMDIRMPVMDGITAAKEIRKLTRPDAQQIPIIAMTANAFTDDVEETRAAGMNAHLSKPIEPEALFSTLAMQCPNQQCPAHSRELHSTNQQCPAHSRELHSTNQQCPAHSREPDSTNQQ